MRKYGARDVGPKAAFGGEDGGFRDETMPETFARRMSPADYASQSQMIHYLHGLSHWIQRQSKSIKEARRGNNVL
jgi:hypothetical protein